MGTITEILALHGWTTSTDKWQPFKVFCLENNIKLTLPNIPGLTRKISNPWTLTDYIDWLKKQIGTKKVILLGHSNGGRIALAFTAKYPENVKRLILIDSAGIYHNEISIKIKRIVFQSIARIGKKITASEKIRKLLYKLVGESDYEKADEIQKQTMINLISQDLTPSLNKIKVHTLIIWGEKDSITRLSDGRLIHDNIKNSKFKIVAKAKHCPQYTHPKEVAKIIHEYL